MREKCPAANCARFTYLCKNTLSPFYARFVEIYSCGFHGNHRCRLCCQKIKIWTDSLYYRLYGNAIASINVHFIEHHSFNQSAGNNSIEQVNGPLLIGDYYCGIMDGVESHKVRYCYIANILLKFPHFMCLRPEFSFSDIMDKFNCEEIDAFDLFSKVLAKTFSCVICEKGFESFPSYEVYMAHVCIEANSGD